MKLIKLVCPNCGAPLQIDPDHPIHFCSYCGTPLAFDNDTKTVNINYNVKKETIITDKARITESRMEVFKAALAVIFAIFMLLFLFSIVLTM